MNFPTKLTVLRILMIPLFIAFFFISAIPYNRFIAVGIFMLASFTDFLDGYLARKNNQVTNLGKFLDPIADKMLVSCALIGIVFDISILQIYVAICSMIILCRELAVSGFRIVASSKNVVLAADKLGKIKTVLQMIAIIILIPYPQVAALHVLTGDIFLYVGFGVLGLATVMTIISGIHYFVKNKEVLKD